MSNADTATAFAAALSAHDPDKAAALMTDDFTATGLAPITMTKEIFLAGQRAWYAGCPDWTVTPGGLTESGATVNGKVTITGTHTSTLSLPGAPTLPPTGKRLTSTDDATMTIRDGKVAVLAITQGTPTLMQQLGLE
ncbi:MAG: nuclear transport factor 2 family protein [Ktedonobacterales bacterium]